MNIDRKESETNKMNCSSGSLEFNFLDDFPKLSTVVEEFLFFVQKGQFEENAKCLKSNEVSNSLVINIRKKN